MYSAVSLPLPHLVMVSAAMATYPFLRTTAMVVMALSSYRCKPGDLLEMTDVIEHFKRFDFKRRIAGDFELFARAHRAPVAAAGQFDLAYAGVDFHNLRRAGVEGEFAWK